MMEMEEDESRLFLRLGNDWNDASSEADKKDSPQINTTTLKLADLDSLQSAKLRFHEFVAEIQE